MPELVRVASVQEVPLNSGKTFEAGQRKVAVFNVEGRGDARVQVSSTNNRLDMGGSQPDVIGLESHRVSWSQPFGEGRSTFAAQYTAENNFYGFGNWSPGGIPSASRSWRLEGSYATPITDRISLETGFRYRERQGQYADRQGQVLPSEQIDLLIEEVEALVADGTLKAYLGRVLISKLRLADYFYGRGYTRVARLMMRFFIHKVRLYERRDILSPEQADPLIAAARDIIRSMRS